MSIKLQRFEFGNLRDFRGPLVVAPEPESLIEEEVYVPPAPTFSELELQTARTEAKQQGYAEGFEAGIKRASEQLDAKRIATDAVVVNLGHQLHSIRNSYQQLLDKEAESLSQLVFMIARKVAGEALETNVQDTITALVTRCLPVIMSKPRLNIELNPHAFEQSIGHIENLLQTSGFEGEIQFRTNPAIGPHDAILDWGAGQATRSTATLWQEIESLLREMPVTLAPLAFETDIIEPVQVTGADITVEQNGSVTDIETPPTL